MRLRGLAKGTPTATRGPAPVVPLPSAIVRCHVLLGAAITALGGLLFGYDTGVISGALLFIGKDCPGRHIAAWDMPGPCVLQAYPSRRQQPTIATSYNL